MKLRTHVVASIVLLMAALPAFAQDGRKHIVLGRTPADMTGLPFSDAVLVGDTLYLSGYIGVDAKTDQVPKSAEAEVRLAMDDLKRTVEAAGMTMDDLVKIDVLCTDITLFPAFNSVYRTYFKNGFPARTFTGSSKLLAGAHFEITGVAIKRAK
ncbi:RidA family protein [Dyella marensis]|jgi:reactive intermediate/imine deaminase|uniref:Reactive intermediate/imine deaminase n=1 Tax=Dyella marensis TaxID=500610 RepID=A0A1I1WXP9_9GAMM|nr:MULTISPECIES: RidA family protein [Dyella]SFD98233.1 reactive intermediate/imine deaminase [Dyella marensis]